MFHSKNYFPSTPALVRFSVLRCRPFGRALVAIGIVGAFLLAIALSDAPGLHERIHNAYGGQHVCAVTMVSSGNCEHIFASASVKPHSPPPVFAFNSLYRCSAIVPLGFSLLEH